MDKYPKYDQKYQNNIGSCINKKTPAEHTATENHEYKTTVKQRDRSYNVKKKTINALACAIFILGGILVSARACGGMPSKFFFALFIILFLLIRSLFGLICPKGRRKERLSERELSQKISKVNASHSEKAG